MRIKAGEIAERLANNTEQVASMLLPNGKRDGSYWAAGDVSGGSGKSLKVYLTGQRAGRWADYAGDDGGDLLDLWAATKFNGNISEAMKDAADWLGIRPDNLREPKREHSKPVKRFTALKPEHRQWLNSRGLADESIDAFGLGSSNEFIAFPSYLDGELVRVKYRTPDKKFNQEKDCIQCLFGWQAIPDKARSVAIVEGECFPPEVEVLTEQGWIQFKDYRGGKVAQWDAGEISMVYPIARVQRPYEGDLIRYQNNGFASITTPDHNMISISWGGKTRKHKAIDGAKSKTDLLPRCGTLEGEGIPLTNEQIKLCIAVSADAAIDHRKMIVSNSYYGRDAKESRYAKFGFKKERKSERLRSILDSLGFEYSDTLIANGYTSICLSIPDWVIGRKFPWHWITQATPEQRELILSELVHWDGNSVPNRNQHEYTSKHKYNADWVQALAHTAGRCSTIIPRSNEFGKWFKVSILHGKQTSSWQTMKGKFERIPYSGDVYCVQVPAGAIMVRQEGAVSVSGNCDAIAMHQYGMPTLSVPNGGGRKQSHWIEVEYDNLSRFDTIYLALDGDEEGEAATAEILDRFGTDRCRLIKLPHKDANDCLKAGITKDQMRECFKRAICIDPEELRRPHDFYEDLKNEFYGEPDHEVGFGLPFEAIRREFRCRGGEVIVLAGRNGEGKSQFAGHMILEAMRDHYRVCVGSFEMKPPRYLKRLARQSGGVELPTENYLREIDNGGMTNYGYSILSEQPSANG